MSHTSTEPDTITAPAAPTVAPLTARDVQFLRAVDFEPALSCQSSSHKRSAGDDPAVWHVHVKCPKCADEAKFDICEPCRALKMAPGHIAGCGYEGGLGCGYFAPWIEFVISFAPVVP